MFTQCAVYLMNASNCVKQKAWENKEGKNLEVECFWEALRRNEILGMILKMGVETQKVRGREKGLEAAVERIN